MSDEETKSDGIPVWEREPVTLEEAISLLINEACDIEDFQRRGLPTPVSPTAMRKALVLRYAATIAQIVLENSEEFKRMIAAKRLKEKRGRSDATERSRRE